MQSVKINKDRLLAKVKANRDSHRDLFLKAQEGYRAQVIKELDAMLKEAREGKPIRRAVQLPEPMDHTDDYDRVIAMLDMSVQGEVELSSNEFDQYVLDNWSWSRLANFTNTSYLGN